MSTPKQPRKPGRPKSCWSLRVGGPGSYVTVYERTVGGPLWLRWWTLGIAGEKGRWQYRPLKHADKDVATQTAREVSAALLASVVAEAKGQATVADVISVYMSDVCAHWKGQGPSEGKRRAAIWTAYLGTNRNAESIDFPTIDRYARDRRAGLIKIEMEPGKPYKLKASPSDRAIGADVDFLMSALNHATRVMRPNGKRMLEANPLRGYSAPKNKNPRRPVATYDRFLALVAKADEADPQKLFAGFMMMLEGLGWRVTAVCSLRACDVDLRTSTSAPHGLIFKNPAMDKEGVGGWLPLSADVRAGVDRVRAVNPSIGELPMFPAPKARRKLATPTATVAAPMIQPSVPVTPPKANEIPKAWTRYHARELLHRAETLAGLDTLEGSDFHAYRRKWATERKHLPQQDVATVGAWRDLRTLQNAYMQIDDATVLAVVNEPRKLRDPAALKTAGEAS